MRFHGGDDLVKIADSASYLTPISEIDRARKYPYHAPSGGFVLSNGDLFHLDESHLSHDQQRWDSGWPDGGFIGWVQSGAGAIAAEIWHECHSAGNASKIA